MFCERCFNISDSAAVPDLPGPGRDQRRLCVVEEPLDVLALERTGEFQGLYHVLHGAMSPIDGIGPDGCASASCSSRPMRRRDGNAVDEVILATNPTLEGEATAMYLAERLEPSSGWSAASPAACRSAGTSSTPTR